VIRTRRLFIDVSIDFELVFFFFFFFFFCEICFCSQTPALCVFQTTMTTTTMFDVRLELIYPVPKTVCYILYFFCASFLTFVHFISAMIAASVPDLASVASVTMFSDDEGDEDDGEEHRGRRRRLNVTEKFVNVISKRVSIAFTHRVYRRA